jgi:hypothetical protein
MKVSKIEAEQPVSGNVQIRKGIVRARGAA